MKSERKEERIYRKILRSLLKENLKINQVLFIVYPGKIVRNYLMS